ncbi:MAG: hypothetical protein Faunusvirus11_1, partial [Faunusvirus sp.]
MIYMQSMNARRNEFMKLAQSCDVSNCLRYIDEYDDFYDAIVDDTYDGNIYYNINILQFVCKYKLQQVAIALIDKKCDLTYQNENGYTAIMYASFFGLRDVVAYIIDNLTDVITRINRSDVSEIMYICTNEDDDNTIKMIDRGYDIYYKTKYDRTLFIEAVSNELTQVVTKLIDVDTDFIEKFNIYYCETTHIKYKFYDDVVKYCHDKHDAYRHEIIATMNSASPENALYQSFHTIYAVELVDIICDF